MTRNPRAVAAILALLFLLAGVGDALGAHHCPHHDGVPAGTATAAAHEHGPGAGHGSGVEHGPGADSGSHGPCTCVGQCHAGAAPSLQTPAIDRDLPVPGPPPLSFHAPRPELRPAIVPFSLPWGNAPPSL